MRSFIFLFSCCLFLSEVNAQNTYNKEIAAWKNDRLKELKAENGWLNLAGLFWLEEGRQTFGGAKTDAIRFPIPSFPAGVGYYERNANKVTQVIDKAINIKVNGRVQKKTVVFHPDSLRQPVLSFGSYRWTFIKREDKIGIRFRNLEHPAVKALKEIPCFPIDTLFRVQAKLIRPILQAKIPIENVLGQTTMQFSPGKLLFSINGNQYTLDALTEEDKLFIIFGDATSGKTTYPAGRFLYATMPGDDGMTVLDFNKSYNPPCAFTPFATCPLPPKQNILPIAITAGELKAGNH
jgi:uncharacterized protein (DUF1684 family)